MITRTFHPIGQGAFYSERIGDKTIVYDCGVWSESGEQSNNQTNEMVGVKVGVISRLK